MTAGRSGNYGNDAAKRESSETGFEESISLEETRTAMLLTGTVSRYRDCYRVFYRLLAHGTASAGGSAAWRHWDRLNPPKMAPFLAAPNTTQVMTLNVPPA